MRLVNQINLNHLKVFEAVYRANNMTKAAQELNLTQSGISQHIKTLEDNLGLILFDRDKHRLIPTANGNALYEKCVRGLNELERTLRQLCASSKEMTGHVKIALPTEFGMNVVQPIINKLLTKNPEVIVEYSFGLGRKITDLVINGEVDFAFVDGYSVERKFNSDKVFEEKIELCGSLQYLKPFPKSHNHLEFYKSLRYIEYMRGGPIIQLWLKYHLKTDDVPTSEIDIVAISPIAQSVYRMIKAGLGVGILPHHFLEHLPKPERDRLYVFPGCGKHLSHTISMISLPDRTQSRATEFFMSAIKDELKNIT